MQELKYELDTSYHDCNYFKLQAKGEKTKLDMEIYRWENSDSVIALLQSERAFSGEEISDLVSAVKDPILHLFLSSQESYIKKTQEGLEFYAPAMLINSIPSEDDLNPQSFGNLYSTAMNYVDKQSCLFLRYFNEIRKVDVYFGKLNDSFSSYVGFYGPLPINEIETCFTKTLANLKDLEITDASDGIIRG